VEVAGRVGAATQPGEATGRLKQVAVVIGPAILGQVCVHAAMAGMRMAAPFWALESGHGRAVAGFLVALFAMAQIVVCLPAGRFADRHGLRLPMAVSVLLAVPGIAVAAAWPGIAGFAIAALLSGGAVAIVTITVQRHVGRAVHSAADLRSAFAMVSIAPAIANSAGPALTGALIDIAGYQSAFGLLAIVPLLAWLLVRRATEAERQSGTQQQGGGSAWNLLAGGHMQRLIFLNTLMVATWEFHSFMVPILGHERQMSATAIGSVLGAFALGAMLVRIAVPKLLGRYNEATVITSALRLSGLLLLTYPFTLSTPTMLGCSTVLGMALGAVQPSVLSMLHHITPAPRQGQALAVRLIFSSASSLAVPLVLGIAGGMFGASSVFWLVGTAVAAGSRVGLQAGGATRGGSQ
jgi:MFS family permease